MSVRAVTMALLPAVVLLAGCSSSTGDVAVAPPASTLSPSEACDTAISIGNDIQLHSSVRTSSTATQVAADIAELDRLSDEAPDPMLGQLAAELSGDIRGGAADLSDSAVVLDLLQGAVALNRRCQVLLGPSPLSTATSPAREPLSTVLVCQVVQTTIDDVTGLAEGLTPAESLIGDARILDGLEGQTTDPELGSLISQLSGAIKSNVGSLTEGKVTKEVGAASQAVAKYCAAAADQ